MRAGDGRHAFWAPGRATWWIIGVNAVLWFVYASAANSRGNPFEPNAVAVFIHGQLLLHTSDVFASGKVWQLFTAIWFHAPEYVGHVFWNMLLLFFFGRTVEAHLGSRRYWWLYIGGGLASTVIGTGYAYLTGNHGVALGASGAVYAVLTWLAFREPHRTILLFFVLPVPLWVLVGVFMVGSEVVNVAVLRLESLSSVAHLAGAAWGWLFYARFARYAAVKAKGPGAWLAKKRREREAAQEERGREEAGVVKADVDRLLAKISDEGIEALTEEEKAFLQEASKRYK